MILTKMTEDHIMYACTKFKKNRTTGLREEVLQIKVDDDNTDDTDDDDDDRRTSESVYYKLCWQSHSLANKKELSHFEW